MSNKLQLKTLFILPTVVSVLLSTINLHIFPQISSDTLILTKAEQPSLRPTENYIQIVISDQTTSNLPSINIPGNKPTSMETNTSHLRSIPISVKPISVSLPTTRLHSRVNTASIALVRMGDIKGNNFVGQTDYSILVSSFFKNAFLFNSTGDGFVNLTNSAVLAHNHLQLDAHTIRQIQSDVGLVDLRLMPAISVVSVGQEFEIRIEAVAGNVPVLGVQAILIFDPTVIQVLAVTRGDTFTTTLANQYDNSKGEIDFVGAQFPGDPEVSGTFTVATIQLQLIGETPSSLIEFYLGPSNPMTKVTNLEQPDSILGDVENGVIMVSPPNAAPSLNYYTTNTPTLTWTGISWAIEYEIQVDDMPTFIAPLEFTAILDASNLSVTIPPASALVGGTHYWQVRAKNSAGKWGAWNIPEKFTVNPP